MLQDVLQAQVPLPVVEPPLGYQQWQSVVFASVNRLSLQRGAVERVRTLVPQVLLLVWLGAMQRLVLLVERPLAAPPLAALRVALRQKSCHAAAPPSVAIVATRVRFR